MGSFETKIVIPDLTTEQKYLPISSVVLSYQRENLAAPVGSAERDKKLLAANPLIQDNEKLVPSVTRVFRKDYDMYVYLEIYHRQRKRPSYWSPASASIAGSRRLRLRR